MGGAVNGMAAHGGIVRPYGSTFLQFADYMRGSIRLSALTGLHVAWVFTHDSVALGEDGPTHQPVEHLAALRAIPGLVVLRPGDAHETAEAWRVILEDLEGPAALVALAPGPAGARPRERRVRARPTGVAQGRLRPRRRRRRRGDRSSRTGSEVCGRARRGASSSTSPVRVVSMPSWELFEQQDDDYQESVLPVDLPTVSVEAGVAHGLGALRRRDRRRSTASAPRRRASKLLEELGITPANVADARARAARRRRRRLSPGPGGEVRVARAYRGVGDRATRGLRWTARWPWRSG